MFPSLCWVREVGRHTRTFHPQDVDGEGEDQCGEIRAESYAAVHTDSIACSKLVDAMQQEHRDFFEKLYRLEIRSSTSKTSFCRYNK